MYAQEREVPLQEVSCNDGTSPDVNGLCADGSQQQGQPPQQLVCSDGLLVLMLTVFVPMAHSQRTSSSAISL